jgi:uncharacterized secreted protein with C-terminal beta-propeller domain
MRGSPDGTCEKWVADRMRKEFKNQMCSPRVLKEKLVLTVDKFEQETEGKMTEILYVYYQIAEELPGRDKEWQEQSQREAQEKLRNAEEKLADIDTVAETTSLFCESSAPAVPLSLIATDRRH